MGQAFGVLTTQNYTVNADGTFSVSDSTGNHFVIAPPGGLPSGTLSTSLVGNSSFAQWTFLLKVSGITVATMSVTYFEKIRDCQPSGVKVTISGNVNWPTGRGVVTLPFKSIPGSVSGYRAWFSNSSGVALGFDWSDSAALNPSYSSTINSLWWAVGDTFTIDPVTVTTSTSSFATEFSYQTHTCSAVGRTWVFYFDGTHYEFTNSKTGLSGNWSSPTTISTSGAVGAGGIAIACSGTQIYRATASGSSGSGWWFDSGSFNSAGTISWGTEIQLSTSQYRAQGRNGPTATVDTSGRVWVAIYNQQGQHGTELWVCASSCGSSSSWSLNHSVQQASGAAQVLPLTSGKLAFVYEGQGHNVITYDGVSTWSSPVSGPFAIDTGSQFATLGDTVEACSGGSTSLTYSGFTYGASGWSSQVALDYSSNIASCAVSTDGKSTVAITDIDVGNAAMKYFISTSAGSTWSNGIALDPYESSSNYMSGPLTFSNTVSAVYESGNSSPYNIRFFVWPVTMPTAANTKYSWGKLGLSPYESYFQNFGEFLSSGNGLLTLVMGTASVPGRGLDLETGLVYTNPYTFRPSGSAYQYENFTLSKLGAGWALDLPWMGPGYLHMPGGEAIMYSSTNLGTMVYQGDTDFTLTPITINGVGGYNLTLKDGTVYQFQGVCSICQPTPLKLEYEYDHTRNNSLTFYYGGGSSGNYLSSIYDSLNRYISFGYNSNNYLTTITSAGRTWTLAYSSTSPAQLVSVTDPLGRVTTFQYAGTSGANLWLLSAILYPTGGKTTYSFGNMAYGTEANYYYVTSRNVYSSSTQLVRTDSLSYTALNSQILWSNMTSSDGHSYQSYTRTNYNTGAGTQKVYDLNSAGTVFRITENDYDSYGRVATTKLKSPSGTTLATSTTSFDAWGNEIFTKDFVGQQTYYSYANTDTSGLFTNSSVSYQASVIPVTITNLQGSATPNPFQQLVSFIPLKYSANESSNLGNIRFCADRQCSTKLYAWLESCSPSCTPSATGVNVWVKLTSSIPANSQTIIWMKFNSMSTNFDGNYWGEAPTLSATYGQYDNGKNVFSWYDNFAGTTLPSDMSVANIGTNTWSVNNGLRITPTASGDGGVFYKTSAISASVIEASVWSTSSYTLPTVGLQLGAPQSQNQNNLWLALTNSYVNEYCTPSNQGCSASQKLAKDVSGASTVLGQNTGLSTVPVNTTLTLAWPSTGTESSQLNYVGQLSSTDSSLTKGSTVYPVISSYGNGYSSGAVYWWVRTRVYPIGGVMPTAYAGYYGIQACSYSFYSQTISNNIANFPVAKCDLQNGAGSAQQETFYKYDKQGNLLEQKVSHNGGWLYTDHTYDKYGNVLSTTDANGHTTYYRYSATYSSAYLTKQSVLVGTQNVTTYYTYDSAKGFKLTQVDPNGQTTRYQYDVLGRQTSLTYPAVNGIQAFRNYTYDDTRNILTITGENGNVAKARFDGLGRESSLARLNGSSTYSNETYTFNWLNLMASKTTAAGNTYTYSYDSIGRGTRVTNPDSVHSYSTISYDDVNNLKTVTDENGHQTVYAYNWNGWLTSVKQYNSSSTWYTTTYIYDPAGNLLSTTDAKSQQTSYQYDDLNRLVTTTFPTSPTTTETRTYDGVGNMLTKTTANGSQISYTYDVLNRLTKITYPGSGGTVTYSYDPDSNRLSMVNPTASDYYTYDARDRLTNQTQVVGAAKFVTLYQYDKASNVVQITYPDGYALSMTYDGVNRLKKVGTYATLTHTLDDKVSKITFGDGEVTTYAYDSRDRPTRILDVSGGTHELDLNYTYDYVGNVLTENTQGYSYDWLNRLTQSTGPWSTITNSYDQVGNRVKMVSGTTTTLYTYGAYNRMTAAGGTTYQYDANGNMASKNTTAWTYKYDYEDRLLQVKKGSTVKATNSYDGDGNRVQQSSGSTVMTYSYQGLNILYEKNVTGSTTTITKHFYAGGLQVAKMVGTGVYYLHADVLGSTRLEVTPTLTVVYSSNYKPYGPAYQLTGSEVFRYTGMPYDASTSLYLFGARFYDPSLGRFVAEDSYNGTKEQPLTQNRYIYAVDNPMRYVDPSGHMIDACGGDCGGGPIWQIGGGPTYASLEIQHTEQELLDAFINGGMTPPLDGIPAWMWPGLLAFVKPIGLAPALMAELLLPSIIAYDVKNHLTQYQTEDAALAAVLTTSLGSIIAGMYATASIIGSELGAGLLAYGFTSGFAVYLFVTDRLNHDAALVEALGRTIGIW